MNVKYFPGNQTRFDPTMWPGVVFHCGHIVAYTLNKSFQQALKVKIYMDVCKSKT